MFFYKSTTSTMIDSSIFQTFLAQKIH